MITFSLYSYFVKFSFHESGFGRLKQCQNRESKYTFVRLFPGIAKISTREIQLPNFREQAKIRKNKVGCDKYAGSIESWLARNSEKLPRRAYLFLRGFKIERKIHEPKTKSAFYF